MVSAGVGGRFGSCFGFRKLGMGEGDRRVRLLFVVGKYWVGGDLRFGV